MVTATRTTYQIDILSHGQWEPQCRIPDVEAARAQVMRLVASMQAAGYEVRQFAKYEGPPLYWWNGGGVRLVMTEVEE